MLKVVFFDWGNTFSIHFHKKRGRKMDKILKPFGFNWQSFSPIWRQFYILRSSGKIKNDRDFEIYIKRITQKEIPVKEIIKIRVENQFIPKEHIEVVKELKKDYKVGILSNNVQEWVERVIKNYKIERLFDAVIISSKVGERKPNAVIYYEALNKLSVKPEETVFIADEVADDLVGASSLGIKTIWFKTNYENWQWWNRDYKKVLTIYKPDATVKKLKEVITIIKKWK